MNVPFSGHPATAIAHPFFAAAVGNEYATVIVFERVPWSRFGFHLRRRLALILDYRERSPMFQAMAVAADRLRARFRSDSVSHCWQTDFPAVGLWWTDQGDDWLAEYQLTGDMSVAAALTAPRPRPAIADASVLRVRQEGSDYLTLHLLPRLAGFAETSWLPVGEFAPDLFVLPIKPGDCP